MGIGSASGAGMAARAARRQSELERERARAFHYAMTGGQDLDARGMVRCKGCGASHHPFATCDYCGSGKVTLLEGR